VVAFVFSGDAPEADGSSVILDVASLRKSCKHVAISEGLAYPSFYKGLFSDLHAKLAAATKAARDAGLGNHAIDSSITGFDVAH